MGRSHLGEVAVATGMLLVMVVSVQPQYALSALAPLILDDLSGSHVGYGSLLTAMFLVAGVASPLAGTITDRLGAQLALLLFFATSAVSLVLVAVAPFMLLLMVAAAIGGVGLAWCNPVTNGLLLSHISERGRGLVLGVKQSGVTLGIVLAGMVLPGLAVWLGWRTAAVVSAGAVVAAGALTTGLILWSGPVVRRRSISSPTGGARPDRRLVLYAFFMGAGISSTTGYLVLYAHEDLGLSLRWAGLLLACNACVGVVARLTLGVVAHRVPRPRLLLLCLGFGAAVAAALILAGATGALGLLWTGVVLMGLTGTAWNVIAMYIVVGDAGDGGAGAATGHLQRGFYAGFCIWPLAFGTVVEGTSSYTPAWWLVVAAFLAAAVVIAPTREVPGHPSIASADPMQDSHTA